MSDTLKPIFTPQQDIYTLKSKLLKSKILYKNRMKGLGYNVDGIEIKIT